MNWKSYYAILSASIIFLLVITSIGAEEMKIPDDGISIENSSKKLSQGNPTDTIFKFEKRDQSNLLLLKGSGINRQENDDNNGSFGLEALFGHLFFPDGDQFSGYYFLSGKIETDSRQRLNATLGYFLPKIGGEAKLTYRMLHAEIRDDLSSSEGFDLLWAEGFEESTLEQGFGMTYRKRTNILIKELVFKYVYTHLGEESVERDPANLDSATAWKQIRADIGFGDVDTHEALFEIGLGSDDPGNPVLQGIRLDIGGGYQNVTYGEFHDTPEVSDTGFSGIAEVKACTPVGVFKGFYQDSQAAKTSYGGCQIGGLDLYYKNIDYEYGQDEEVIGIALTVDLLNPSSIFDTKCSRFFSPSDTGYTSVYQMGHIGGLASNEFTAKPKVRVVYETIFSVDKSQMASNVRIDDSGDSGDPRLIVTTDCDPVRIVSVSPTAATSAFGVNGNEVSISLAGLPNQQQTVVARVADRCCGDTQITVATNVGSLTVDSVNVRDGVGCQVTETETETETETIVDQEPESGQQQCLAIGASCNINSDACCAGSSCLSVPGVVPFFICQ